VTLHYTYNVRTFALMADLRFEWDPKKAAENHRKHGIAFEEAHSVFVDEHALLLDDPDHSTHDDRFVLLGLSAAMRVLVVVHGYRESEGVIRLISARKATRTERAHYLERWRS
jgi:uncharacterized DUF497 family protein